MSIQATVESLARQVMDLARTVGAKLHGPQVSWGLIPYSPNMGLGDLALMGATNYVTKKVKPWAPIQAALRAQVKYRQGKRVLKAAKVSARRAAKAGKYGALMLMQLPQIVTTFVIGLLILMLVYGLWVVARKVENVVPWNLHLVPSAMQCQQTVVHDAGFLWWGKDDNGRGTSFTDFAGAMTSWAGRKIHLSEEGMVHGAAWTIAEAGTLTAVARHALSTGNYFSQDQPKDQGSAHPSSYGSACCPTTPGLPAGGIPAAYKLPALSAEQVSVVQTTIRVALERGVSTYGMVVALAAGNQESGLRNLAYGDRDSLGVWQERPSQGWGTAAQVQDVAYAAGAFFEHLAAVPGWEQMTVTQAAQAVERSAFPDAYADDEALARALVAQYTGGTVQTVAAGCAAPTSVAGPVAQQAIDFAMGQLGKPYVWGSAPMPTPTGPVPATFDCSSLIDSAYLAAGVDLPGRQTTATLILLGTAVPFAQVQPGDLVFDDPGHVMLALGGGMVVEAPNSQSVVRTRAITGAWAVRRIVGAGATA